MYYRLRFEVNDEASFRLSLQRLARFAVVSRDTADDEVKAQAFWSRFRAANKREASSLPPAAMWDTHARILREFPSELSKRLSKIAESFRPPPSSPFSGTGRSGQPPPKRPRQSTSGSGQAGDGGPAIEATVTIERIGYGSFELLVGIMGLSFITGTDPLGFQEALKEAAKQALNAVFSTDVPLLLTVDDLGETLPPTDEAKKPETPTVRRLAQASPYLIPAVITIALIWFWNASFSKLVDRQLEDQKIYHAELQKIMDATAQRDAAVSTERRDILAKLTDVNVALIASTQKRDESLAVSLKAVTDQQTTLIKELNQSLTARNNELLDVVHVERKPAAKP